MINTNTALRALQDDGLMIGRHRGVIGTWFQNWVEEFGLIERVPDEKTPEASAALARTRVAELKEKLIAEIEASLDEMITVSVDKVALVDGWRKGTPVPQGAERGLEVSVRFFGFRNTSRETASARLSPTDRNAVLSREGIQR